MCVDAAENPMMYVPWWVNIGWFHAMRSSGSGKLCETQHLHHPRTIIAVRDGREVLVER